MCYRYNSKDLPDRQAFGDFYNMWQAFSSERNKMAAWLIENKMIDFIGSDAHHAGQQHLFQNAFSSKLFEKLKATATVRNNTIT
jgi:tyrosine-protein phosphatase YwqE